MIWKTNVDTKSVSTTHPTTLTYSNPIQKPRKGADAHTCAVSRTRDLVSTVHVFSKRTWGSTFFSACQMKQSTRGIECNHVSGSTLQNFTIPACLDVTHSRTHEGSQQTHSLTCSQVSQRARSGGIRTQAHTPAGPKNGLRLSNVPPGKPLEARLQRYSDRDPWYSPDTANYRRHLSSIPRRRTSATTVRTPRTQVRDILRPLQPRCWLPGRLRTERQTLSDSRMSLAEKREHTTQQS